MITPYPEENSHFSLSFYNTHRSDTPVPWTGVSDCSGTGWGYLQKIHIADMIEQYFSVKIRPYPVFIGYLPFLPLFTTHTGAAPRSQGWGAVLSGETRAVYRKFIGRS